MSYYIIEKLREAYDENECESIECYASIASRVINEINAPVSVAGAKPHADKIACMRNAQKQDGPAKMTAMTKCMGRG